MADALLSDTIDGESLRLAGAGAWTSHNARPLEELIEAAAQRHAAVRRVAIDMGAVERLDTFGAWLLERLVRAFSTRGCATEVLGLKQDYRALIDELHQVKPEQAPRRRANPIFDAVVAVGRQTVSVGEGLVAILNMLGALGTALARVIAHPARFRFTALVHQLDKVAWRGVPIIMLITFLVGSIIAQQGIFHFRQFGADIYVVDMIGILVLRELGVLIVCIMVAGRSGSAYTAELGSMKMREEIDALRTMGFDPIEVLVLPRMLALVLALPILAFLGAMAALYGGGLVAWLYGGVDPEAFLLRLRDAISIDHFIVGIVKAPVMAAVIGIVACVEGLAVQGSAESLGQHTTSSVVKGIFFVIVMDGVFAIFFASIGM